MNGAEIRARLTPIFREVFDDDTIEIRDEMTAKDVEEWDSLNHINLIVAVERSFGVKFTTKEVSNLANVGEFIGLIAAKLAKA
ncbi:MAG TPA: acyl carrier protein [Candidatus Binatia bacterium]|nr:acyl carrier protein [Candidatus Binatia bacterium]